jgi:hypothetical protein
MITQDLLPSGLFHWTTGLALGVGFMVAGGVYLSLQRYVFRERRLLAAVSCGGFESPPAGLLQMLSLRLQGKSARHAVVVGHESWQQFEDPGFFGDPNWDRPRRFRYGNPTEVEFTSSSLSKPGHGLVFRQSADALGVLVDQKTAIGTLLQIRSAEAPDNIPWVEVEVTSCQKVWKKNFIISCHFRCDVPWNVRVWFG